MTHFLPQEGALALSYTGVSILAWDFFLRPSSLQSWFTFIDDDDDDDDDNNNDDNGDDNNDDINDEDDVDYSCNSSSHAGDGYNIMITKLIRKKKCVDDENEDKVVYPINYQWTFSKCKNI